MQTARARTTAALLPLAAEPLDGTRHAVGKRDLGLEAEALPGPRHIELPTRLAIRLRRVPDDLAVEARGRGDRLGEVLD